MNFSGNGSSQPDWANDSARAHAFRDLVTAISTQETYTDAVDAAARPIALGLGAAVMIGLLDGSRDVIHALGVHDPLPTRAQALDLVFDEPFERRGYIREALEKEQPVLTEVDEDYMREMWPQYAEVSDEFRLRFTAVAAFKTLGGICGVIWAGRAE